MADVRSKTKNKRQKGERMKSEGICCEFLFLLLRGQLCKIKDMNTESNAKDYQRIKLGLSLTETVLSFLLLAGFVFTGYSAKLRDLAAQIHANAFVQLIVFVVILGAGFLILFSPFSIVSGFWLEHRFNLSNQRFCAWLWEQAKRLFLAFVLLIPLLLLAYYFLRSFPQSWWFWTAVALFVFSVLIGKIAPTVIFPFFYKFEPISDDTLLERMKRLAQKGNFLLTGVYRFNMSKTTKRPMPLLRVWGNPAALF